MERDSRGPIKKNRLRMEGLCISKCYSDQNILTGIRVAKESQRTPRLPMYLRVIRLENIMKLSRRALIRA